MKVYLSGGIFPNNKPATEEWRNYATQYLELAGAQAINPCRNKGTYLYGQHTPNEIVFRDLKDIDNSHLVLANFVLVDHKLYIGTFMECMYAWINQKPVVIVSQDERIIKHPWLQAVSVRIFPELSEALDYCLTFWRSCE